MCTENTDNLDSIESFLESDPGFLVPYAETSIVMMKRNLANFSCFIRDKGIALSSVDQKTIIDYQLHLKETGISKNTYAQRISHVRTLLKYIGKRFRYRTIKQKPYENINVINLENFNKILFHIEKKMRYKDRLKYSKYLRDLIMFKIFYVTGLRKMEVLNLKHSNIFEENEMLVYQTTVKGGKRVTKEFLKSLYVLVQELKIIEKKESDDYIFTSKRNLSEHSKTKLDQRVPNNLLRTYYETVTGKKSHVTIHGIRNLSGYSVQKHSNDIYTTRSHLNHEKVATTVEYLQQVSVKTRTPIEALNRDLEN